MPPLHDVTPMVTAARSRLIRFTFIIQNFAQLTQVYGKENAETIKGNCNIMYLISSELQALEELSKLCGEKKSKEKDKTASTPLVTVSDLQRLQQYECISLRLRTMPFKTKLVPNYKMDWGRNYEKATYPTRTKTEVELFDIREYVKEMKKKKMAEMMNSEGSDGAPLSMGTNMSNPFMGTNPFAMGNPFAAPRTSQSEDSSFNVDDLVKRSDAKIAELEEEERKEKEEEERKQQMARGHAAPAAIPAKETPEVKVEEQQPQSDVVNKADLTVNSQYADDTDDDNFFDDFFADE
jgi:hypothetical protein